MSDRVRTTASVALAVLAVLLVVVGALALYARAELLDPDSFADRATVALEDDGVRQVAAEQIVVQVIERGSADLIAGRPLLETVVDSALESSAFRQLFREAARQTNLVLFERDRNNVAFDISDGFKVIRFGLESVAPDLAQELPKEVDLALLELKERDFARETLDIADTSRVLGIVLPVLALLALVGSVLLARDRRIGVLRAAVSVGVAGAILAAVLLILHERLLAGVIGADETTDEEARAAVEGILDAFFGDLFGWALALVFAGAIVAGAAAVLDPTRGESAAARIRERLAATPRTRAGRAARAIGVLVVGFWVAVEPEAALRVGAVVAGGFLVFWGAGELLLLLQRPDVAPARAEAQRRRTLRAAVTVGLLGVVAVVGVTLLLTSGGGPERVANASPPGGCNGTRANCRLRLNEAVFAGTHNSFSAADTPGWFIANQRHDIPRQLKDGIRLFLIDPHWGIESANGAVRTDFEAEGRDRNKVAAAMPPEVLAAAERLAGSLGAGEATGEPEIWLCHTVCELGATRMADALDDLSEFLDANPGEVVVLFIEPYVDPEDLDQAFKDAGLAEHAAVLNRDEPLPTLGELVAADNRLVVLTEQDADGSVPYYLDGFSFVQDTPLGATKVKQLSCDLNRGDGDSPILALNHWADLFPPRAGANVPFQTRKELLGRARECERERGLPVGMIAVDHYDRGDLIEVVEELNAKRAAAAKRRAG